VSQNMKDQVMELVLSNAVQSTLKSQPFP